MPGEPVPFERIEAVLGPLPGAPPRVQRWLATTGPMMGRLLDIDEVHYAFDPVTRAYVEDNVTMATAAARAALARAGLEPGDVDLLCYGSAHQDQMPTASVRIQEALGIEVCEELSIHANCTSAYKALYLAHQLLRAGRNRVALVCSASVSSSELRAEYYNQAKVDKESLFLRWYLGDGAGALVLSADPAHAGGAPELEATYIESVGGKKPSLMFNSRPAYWEDPRAEFEAGHHHLRQTFRGALSSGWFQEEGGSVFFKGLMRMLRRENILPQNVHHLQVNMPTRHVVDSILDECAAAGVRREALDTRLTRQGYCGPPMGLMALDALLRDGLPVPGERAVSFVTEVSKCMQAGFSVVGRG